MSISDEVQLARSTASELVEHIRSTDITTLLFRAPIIDRQAANRVLGSRSASACEEAGATSSYDDVPEPRKPRSSWTQTEILGYHKFVQTVERQVADLDVTSRHNPNDSPLPPIRSLVTSWKAVLLADTPVTAVKTMMKGKGKAEAVVDVVCRGGEEWIRLWTKKTSHLLSEFREQDSYENSDWSESGDEQDEADHSSVHHRGGMSVATTSSDPNPKRIRNTLITAAQHLLDVAQHSPRPPGSAPPRITIRLTRMSEGFCSPNGESDARIPETFAVLRRMGIKLQFGDLAEIPLSSLSRRHWERESGDLLPSLKINLDPTALVGLCCDALHHPLPKDLDEARRRCFRPNQFLHESSSGYQTGTTTPVSVHEDDQPARRVFLPESAGGDDYDAHRQSQHSRELFKETLEELRAPLIVELRDTLSKAIAEAGGDARVEIWATADALRHLKEAMGNLQVVGQGMEQQRMRRLIGLEPGDFFEGSRYEGEEGVLKGRMRLSIFAERQAQCEPSEPQPVNSASNGHAASQSEEDAPSHPMCASGIRSFHHSTAAVCKQFLSEYHRCLADPDLLRSIDLPTFLRPDKLPVPKVASLTLPLPIVSLASIQRGAEEGMTTLCMGNVVWRELFGQARWKVRGWTQGSYEVERARAREGTARQHEQFMSDGTAASDGDCDEVDICVGIGQGSAVMWLMPYRSLGEGKRVRFEAGDYSFPVPKP